MFNKMKYIRTEEGFFLFPATTRHDEMAKGIERAGLMSGLSDPTPISAGFVEEINDEITCYGESVSLNIKSAPEDSEALRKQLGV